MRIVAGSPQAIERRYPIRPGAPKRCNERSIQCVIWKFEPADAACICDCLIDGTSTCSVIANDALCACKQNQ